MQTKQKLERDPQEEIKTLCSTDQYDDEEEEEVNKTLNPET